MMAVTGVGTSFACLCTLAAVIFVMLPAFFSAHPADLFTYQQKWISYFRISFKQRRCLKAYISAIPVQADAAGHVSDIFFFKARGGTVLAGKGAIDKSLYQVNLFIVMHSSLIW